MTATLLIASATLACLTERAPRATCPTSACQVGAVEEALPPEDEIAEAPVRTKTKTRKRTCDEATGDCEVVCPEQVELTDLTPLAGLSNLWYLDLGDHIFPCRETEHLRSARELWLPCLPSKDLTPLARSSNLEVLALDVDEVHDLTPLASLSNLTRLNLQRAHVTELAPLSGLTKLTYLDLSYTRVKDLSPLAGLSSLIVLILDHTRVTDLTPLAGLANLEYLWLQGAKVPEEQVERLREKLPRCKIVGP